MSQTVENKKVKNFKMALVKNTFVLSVAEKLENEKEDYIPIGQYSLDESTGRYTTVNKKNQIVPITAQQIASAYADKLGPAPLKRSFGEWLGVIFSFGLWTPKKRYTPQGARRREQLEWHALTTLNRNNNNYKCLSDEEYNNLKPQYKAIVSLRTQEDLDHYIKTGEMPDMVTDEEITELRRTNTPESVSHPDKYPGARVLKRIDDALLKNNIILQGEDYPNYKESVPYLKILTSTIAGNIKGAGGSKNELWNKKVFLTAAYIADLGKDPVMFYKLGQKVKTFLKETEHPSDSMKEDLAPDGRQFDNKEVMINIMGAAALLPEQKFTKPPFELLFDKVLDDPAFYKKLLAPKNAKQVIEDAGLKQYIKKEDPQAVKTGP